MIKYVLTKSHVISCTGLCEKWDSGRENALGRGHRFVERNSLYKKMSSACAHTNRKAGLRLSKQRAILRRKLQVYEEEGEETSVCE